MAHVGYIRVSTVQQNTERQLAGVTLDKEFSEKVSGKDANRPELKACLAYVREGDTLHVHDLSRLGRSTVDVLTIVKELNDRGVAVHFHKEGLVASGDNAMTKMVMTILAAVATAEREMMLERQREGIAAAREAGRNVGRGKGKAIDHKAIVEALSAGMSVRKAAAEFNVAQSTISRIKKEMAEAEALTK